MITKVFLPHSFDVDYCADILVGVDYGAYILAKKGIYVDISIGDFDSVNSEEYNLIKKYSKEIIKLDVKKNETDSEAALIYLKDNNYKNIVMYSDIGERVDHLLNNYRLIEKYDFKLVTKNSEAFLLKEGKHKIKNTHKYLSLYTNNECKLSLNNVLYPLDNVEINLFDTYLTSNEIIEDYAEIEIFSGSIIVILNND